MWGNRTLLERLPDAQQEAIQRLNETEEKFKVQMANGRRTCQCFSVTTNKEKRYL